jgi:2-polyprenyl-3-methyl-5-hydroxy-6-metoxy-1,4-benzoquinol methylase
MKQRETYSYDNYGEFKESAGVRPRSRVEHVARGLGLKNRYMRFLKTAARDKPVLEIGCGNGQFMQEMLHEGFTTVTGVEPSSTYRPVVDPGLIINAFASHYLETCSPSSFGTIVALDVLEHIP